MGDGNVIDYMQNSHLRNRRAVVEMTPEVMVECVTVLVDAGFRIVGSATTRHMAFEYVRLVIEGDALPEACAGELRVVRVTFYTEAYGKQRLTRVQSVEVDAASPAIAA